MSNLEETTTKLIYVPISEVQKYDGLIMALGSLPKNDVVTLYADHEGAMRGAKYRIAFDEFMGVEHVVLTHVNDGGNSFTKHELKRLLKAMAKERWVVPSVVGNMHTNNHTLDQKMVWGAYQILANPRYKA